MRRRHFEALGPRCPVCRIHQGRESPLEIATALSEADGDVLEGILRCTAGDCLREYPILDGIPLIIPRIRSWVAANLTSIVARDDLSAPLESLLGDCCGPGSAFDAARQQLSSYVWDHYGDLDPEEDLSVASPGSVVRLLERGLELAGEVPDGPVLDLGCAAGRTSFALAERRGELVLGVDLNVPLLRLASAVLRTGRVRYPRRRVGLVYDRREFAVDLPGRDNVDFWACDATALPLPAAGFALAASLHLVDCVAAPRESLASIARVLRPGGKALIASPYDWSPAATPVEGWLGGHSQRSADAGASEPVLRALLTPGAHPAAVDGLEIVGEEHDLPWRVRMHERSSVDYRVHLVAAEAAAIPGRSR